MSRREKLLAKIRNNTKNVSVKDLRNVLEWHGFELRRITGSHYIYKRPGCPVNLSVPKNKPIKQCYVKNALKWLDRCCDTGLD